MEDISDLIEMFSELNTEKLNTTYDEMGRAISQGSSREPEKFTELLDAFTAYIVRVFEFSSEDAQVRALGNLASIAVVGDIGYSTMAKNSAFQAGPVDPYFYYDELDCYGSAMSMIANYIGVKGSALRTFLLSENPFCN